MEKRNIIDILAMAFYGNRTGTSIDTDNLDRFILGYQTSSITITEPIDRTIIRVPATEELVIIYNKYMEEERLKRKEELFREEGYIVKPLAVIPEKGIELYSRCIVCRQDPVTGELKSMQNGDYEIACKYLAK